MNTTLRLQTTRAMTQQTRFRPNSPPRPQSVWRALKHKTPSEREPLMTGSCSKKTVVVQRSIAIEFAVNPNGDAPARRERIPCDWRPPVQWLSEIRPAQDEMNPIRGFIRLVGPEPCLAVN